MNKLTKIIVEDMSGTHEKAYEDLIERCLFDLPPGICTECNMVVYEVEPDARNNYCESCGKKKVVSFLVLEGLI